MDALMDTKDEARTYVVRELTRLKAPVMERYAALLASTPPNKVIQGLDPWAFDHDPERAVGFCSEAIGRRVLPFAQAVGEDMVACFETESSGAPAVVVIDPWSSDKARVVLAKLAGFDEWLIYAKDVATAVQKRERDEGSDN